MGMFLGGFYCFKGRQKTSLFLLWMFCMSWALIMGCRRHDVGNDTSTYAAYYENKRLGDYNFYEAGTVNDPGPTIEKGYVLIAKTIHLFTGDHSTPVFIIIELWLFLLIYTLYKRIAGHKLALWDMVFLFSISNIFVTLMVAVRQTVSICVFLTAFLLLQSEHIVKIKFSLLKRKKIILSLALFILAFASHRTSLLIMPFILSLYFIKVSRKRTVILLLTFGFVVSLFMQDSVTSLVNMSIGAMVNTTSENLQLLGDRYSSDYGARNTRLITIAMWYLPFVIATIGTERKNINNFYFKCLILASMLNLFFPGSEMIDRTSTLAMILGFTRFVPDKVAYNSKWRYIYIIMAFIFLGKIFIRFTNWPTDVDSCLPFYFFWQ
jgi:hypothetical protein